MGYVYLSVLGVIYLRSLFGQFSINIMDFVETSDFLIAGFKNPGAVSILLTGAFWALVMYGASYFDKMGPRLGLGPPDSTWQFVLRSMMVLFLLTGALFSILVPHNEGANDGCKIRLGDGQRVGVQLGSSGEEQIQSCLDGDVFLVARTQKFAFFYDLEENYTHIIPIANILHIHHLAEGSTWGCPTTTPVPSPTTAPQPCGGDP